MKATTRNARQRTDGVYSDYPINWPAIAKAVKDAANWRCIRCLHPHEGAWKQSQKQKGQVQPAQCDLACRHDDDGKQRVLTVHHLDLNKANVAWWNLAALCQACHLSVQARVDFHQFYMLDHTPWMRPYIKGWTTYQITGLTIVNVRHVPFDTYIGRPGRRKGAIKNPWENPFPITDTTDRAQSIGQYGEYISGKIAEDPETYDLRQLMDGDAGCWCKPEPCHGDVLADMLVDLIHETIEAL